MRLLEDVLAEEILSGRVSDGDTAMVDIDEEGNTISLNENYTSNLNPPLSSPF
ncbi:hypothetical protein O53_622 [Microcystis aeruginosa TAIHU98]|uniref:Clp ATPase C-terminal domain-containing protein n=1 Tax=Microcystis aeruginosa TAIHU98 TaxID=1134457 RepID=L7EBH8_MICAE|nr:hypothetical protein O53_622 [Microcystis aeruginosa TAIHU98]